MGVPPEPAVSAGLPAFNWYRASALVVPIRGKALNIFAAFAMGVIVLPVPAPQVWAQYRHPRFGQGHCPPAMQGCN